MKSQPPGLSDATTNELLAMLEVMYLVATADGFFSTEERRNFIEHARSLSDGKLEPTHLATLVESWVRRGVGVDPEPRLAELARDLPDETARRIAFGLAMGIAESDEQLLGAEAGILKKISRAFGLEEQDADDIAQSVRMSRRPAED
jgi:tellurite resistance protein